MTKRFTTVFLILFVLAVLTLLWAAFPLPTEPAEVPGQQIVLSFNSRVQTTPTTTLEFFTPETKLALGLLPLDGPGAPEAAGTLAVCKLALREIGVRLLDGKEAGPLNEVLITCGGRRYLFTTLATIKEK